MKTAACMPDKFSTTVIYVDGAGCRPDGSGSGYAWTQVGTQRQRVIWKNGLTNNEAEYRAVISALQKAPPGCRIEVRCDSQLVCCQFEGTYAVKDPKLKRLLARLEALIEERDLQVRLRWVPRRENLADTLLQRKPLRDGR